MMVLVVFLGEWMYSQAPKKDTLFFRLDRSFMEDSRKDEGFYFVKSKSKDGEFFFEEEEQLLHLKPKRIYDFKKYISKLQYYHKKENKIDGALIAAKLYDYVVFLVSQETGEPKYIKVVALVEIE
jgi:hypothetical protein